MKLSPGLTANVEKKIAAPTPAPAAPPAPPVIPPVIGGLGGGSEGNDDNNKQSGNDGGTDDDEKEGEIAWQKQLEGTRECFFTAAKEGRLQRAGEIFNQCITTQTQTIVHCGTWDSICNLIGGISRMGSTYQAKYCYILSGWYDKKGVQPAMAPLALIEKMQRWGILKERDLKLLHYVKEEELQKIVNENKNDFPNQRDHDSIRKQNKQLLTDLQLDIENALILTNKRSYLFNFTEEDPMEGWKHFNAFAKAYDKMNITDSYGNYKLTIIAPQFLTAQ